MTVNIDAMWARLSTNGTLSKEEQHEVLHALGNALFRAQGVEMYADRLAELQGDYDRVRIAIRGFRAGPVAGISTEDFLRIVEPEWKSS